MSRQPTAPSDLCGVGRHHHLMPHTDGHTTGKYSYDWLGTLDTGCRSDAADPESALNALRASPAVQKRFTPFSPDIALPPIPLRGADP